MGLFPGLVAILSSLLSNLGIDITSLFPEDFNTDESEEESQNEKKIWIEILANPNGIKADGADISWIYAKVCTSDSKC
jgi:O-acetylhomoserine/O-acetylserine sulfhydrylase-like pyridoxal-dependent enzyme